MTAAERERLGYEDGYRVGSDGVDPAGNRITADNGYSHALFGDVDYHRGLSRGRSDRIDKELAANGGRVLTVWPGTVAGQ